MEVVYVQQQSLVSLETTESGNLTTPETLRTQVALLQQQVRDSGQLNQRICCIKCLSALSFPYYLI